MMQYIVIIFGVLIFRLNFFTIHGIVGTALKDCKIKFEGFDWQDIDDCDKTSFNRSWSGGMASVDNIHIDFNIGDIYNIWIKAFNNVPYDKDYEDHCSIYMNIKINEYYLHNEKDYIYYCTNCNCTSSLGDKTFCHKWGDKRLYCDPVRGKEYNFFVRINGYHELDLMDTYTIINNYYKILGHDFYLSEIQDNQEIKFSSDSFLVSSYDPLHKVNLDELSIKYSFVGFGEFRTISGEILPSSGVIGSDIIFIKPKNIEGNETFHTKLTVQTISKFGYNKTSSTSDPSEFNFYFCAPGYKMSENKTCYKCFESCFNCSEEGNTTVHHCEKCNHLNPYYFYINDTKNCHPSCKSINKVRREKSNYICIDKNECKNYISSDEESCIENCNSEFEYFDGRTGTISKLCLKNCDEYISNDHTTCLDSCKRINQLFDNINLDNKNCLTEDLCIKYYKFINSDKTSCNQKCYLVSELQDYRYNDYVPNCLSYEQCDKFISYDKEKCILNCPSQSEYYDDRSGTRSKNCLKKEKCDSWISSNDTICLNDCQIINELSDLTSHLCVKFCDNDLYFNPELMTCDIQCNEPYKYFIKYENQTKKCVKKCNEFPYIVLDEDNSECLIFNKFEITSIQMNPIFNYNKNNFPTYFVYKGTKNITIKVTFNQNIRQRIKLMEGNFEKNPENNNSIIIKIEEIKEKQMFNFTDKINDTYFFGFEIDVISSIDIWLIILIVISSVLFISFIISLICFIKTKKKSTSSREPSLLAINNNNN